MGRRPQLTALGGATGQLEHTGDEAELLEQPGPPASPDSQQVPGELGEPLAEAAVLGCALQTTPQHARALLAGLAEQDFTVPQHAHIAAAITVLLGSGEPVDPVTVLGQLRRQGLEHAGTASKDAGVLLLELCQGAPTVASGSFYARIVLEHSYRRRVQRAAVRLLQGAGHLPLTDLADLVSREHHGITAQHRRATTPTRTTPPTAAPTRAPAPAAAGALAAAAVSATPRVLPAPAIPRPAGPAAGRPRPTGCS